MKGVNVIDTPEVRDALAGLEFCRIPRTALAWSDWPRSRHLPSGARTFEPALKGAKENKISCPPCKGFTAAVN